MLQPFPSSDRAAEQPRLRAPLPVLRSANLPHRTQNHYRGGVRVANWVEEEYGDHLAGREGALVRAPPDLRANGGFAGAERGGRAAGGGWRAARSRRLPQFPVA